MHVGLVAADVEVLGVAWQGRVGEAVAEYPPDQTVRDDHRLFEEQPGIGSVTEVEQRGPTERGVGEQPGADGRLLTLSVEHRDEGTE